MDYKKHLEDLRSKLANQHMSLMVGSGFSKNASLKFPAWNELLQDLVYTMHKTEITERYFKSGGTVSSKRPSKESFIKSCCNEIIRKRGYLDVVSDYLRNGHAESIATYIESHTPFVHVNDDKSMMLEVHGKLEVFPADRLNLHRSLVHLPWNNIYTTNYDQLLDLCVDEHEYARLSEQMQALEDEITAFDERLKTIACELEALDWQELPGKETLYRDSETIEKPKPENYTKDEADHTDKKSALDKERKETLENRAHKNDQIKQKERALGGCFNVIKQASELRLKRNKNIIKLHGSLRTKKQKASHYFEFDADNKKQYVIAREDYDEYPQKHEAFTQLMRISLLQESFCLIGFSGDDPNFHAWISWVRDILQRDKKEVSARKSYKIYLIDVNNEEPGIDRQLFYENYNIIRIPITDEQVVQILTNDLQIDDTGTFDRKKILQMFISYLDNDELIKPVISTTDPSAETEWRSSWRKAKIPDKFWLQDDALDTVVERLGSVHESIVVPNFVHTHYQHSLLKGFYYTNRQNLDKPFGPGISRLILYALKDSFLPISRILESTAIAKLEREPEVSAEIGELMERDYTVSLIKDPEVQAGYNRVLGLAFRFRFAELHQYLKAWEPEAADVSKKAGFLSVLDPHAAESYLENQLQLYGKFVPEQKLYLIEQQLFICNSISYPQNKRLTRLLRAYEGAGYRPLYENFDYLMQELENNPDKPEPRGSGRYSVSRGNYNEADENVPQALRYLMLLLESGFQFNIRRAYWITEKKWFKVIKWGFEAYPHAFLYYGLQFGGTDYLKRLGQEYAYSVKLKQFVLNTIAINLMAAIPNAPYTYRNNIEVFLSRMLIAVQPSVWEKPYMELWRMAVREDSAFSEKHLNPLGELNYFAFQYLEKETHLLEILTDIFKNVLSTESDRGVDYLYYLVKNVHYSTIAPETVSSSGMSLSVDQIIGTLNAEKIDKLFVLGNASKLLSENQKTAIAKKIKGFDFSLVHDRRAWEVLLHFVKMDTEAVELLKAAMLKSKTLWHTGVNGNSRTSSEPIMLSRLTISAGQENGIEWSKQEVLEMYELMAPAIEALEGIFDETDIFFFYGDLILEIKWFLERYTDVLDAQMDFAKRLLAIDKLHHKNVNYDSIEEGLLSTVHADVVWALSEVSSLYAKGEARTDLLNIVLNKCLLQSEPALEATLSYITSWFLDGKEPKGFHGMEPQLISILKKYKTHPIPESDVSFLEERLIKIAYELQHLGFANEILSWWTDYAMNANYNNIRQLVIRRKLKNTDED